MHKNPIHKKEPKDDKDISLQNHMKIMRLTNLNQMINATEASINLSFHLVTFACSLSKSSKFTVNLNQLEYIVLYYHKSTSCKS